MLMYRVRMINIMISQRFFRNTFLLLQISKNWILLLQNVYNIIFNKTVKFLVKIILWKNFVCKNAKFCEDKILNWLRSCNQISLVEMTLHVIQLIVVRWLYWPWNISTSKKIYSQRNSDKNTVTYLTTIEIQKLETIIQYWFRNI